MPSGQLPQLIIAAQTDPGCDPAKSVNEDAFVASQNACGTLVSVCDGMGGHEGGRVASTTAIQVLQSLMETAPAEGASARFLRGIIETAGRAVHALAAPEDDEHRPGSTCVALLFGRGTQVVAHVGDSRAYRMRDGTFERLTNDHSVVNDLILAGIMSPAQAHDHPDAHRITRALGMSAQVVVDVRELPELHKDDYFLLCSDGLTDLVADDEIAHILGELSQPDLDAKCSTLIDLAKKRGGHDNVTVVIVRVSQPGEGMANRREPNATESDGTGAMLIPTEVTSAPIQPTIALEGGPRAPIAPTIVEAVLLHQTAADTQPIAINPIHAPGAIQPTVPAAIASRHNWDTGSLSGSVAPRSGARWMLVAAIFCGLVLLGLGIWAVVH